MAPEQPDTHTLSGGTETWHRLSTEFYGRVARDSRLRPLFPGKTLHCAIEELTAFLVQLFDGPTSDSQRRWWLSLRESHARFVIGEAERTAWMENMRAALNDSGLDGAAMLAFFDHASGYVAQSPQTVGELPDEIQCRWARQVSLDQVVAAIRAGRGPDAIELAGRQTWNRSVLVGLLGLMLATDSPEMRHYVREQVNADPALLLERHASRTLLHEAAALGDLAFVELFVSLGADVNARDGGRHTPLYSAANQCQFPTAAQVVRLLVRAGADVHADDGVKRTTPLHMAARRGNVGIAEALLDCGARIDARDSLGETPLRRAVNCDKVAVAAALLRRGADARSVGSKGLTPLEAARRPAMRQLLETHLRNRT
jgi:truncated hemoglobin YjbI